MPDNEVRHELVATMLVDYRPPIRVLVRFTYNRNDPWAVQFEFRDHKDWVPWIMDREMLVNGVNGVAGAFGEGDVRIGPAPDDPDRTRMALSSPAGKALFEFDTSRLVELIALTTHLVPFGAEANEVDWTAELAALTATE